MSPACKECVCVCVCSFENNVSAVVFNTVLYSTVLLEVCHELNGILQLQILKSNFVLVSSW